MHIERPDIEAYGLMNYDRFATVDWVADAERENKARLARLTNSSLFRRALSASQSWLVLAVSGALIGVVAVVMSITSGFLGDLKEGYCSYAFYLNSSFCCLGEDENCAAWHAWRFEFPIYVLGAVALACCACLIVLEFSPFAAGSGISEIKCIAGGFLLNGFLDVPVLVAKIAALPLTIASGFSVGKEGPSVHYAACIGTIVGYYLSSKYNLHNSKRRELVLACSAAGVAVAFGSPIGGVLFAVEEMAAQSSVDMPVVWRSYFCCLVATSVLSLLNPFRTGQMVLFSVQYDRPFHLFEVPFFAILGIFGGLMGQFIIKWNLRVVAMRRAYWADFAMQEVAVIALITAVVCYFNQFLRLDMTKSMQILFHECEHGGEAHPSCDPSNRGVLLVSLATACILRTLLTLVSYGAKVPAGIFVPSLAIGALFGRFLGTLVWWLADVVGIEPGTVSPGTYAFLGAGALLAGVMHITVTVVIVMFELTGALYYIVPLMIVVGVTRLVSSRVGSGGIADMAILANGYPFFASENVDFNSQKAGDVMVSPVSVLDPTQAGTEHSTYPIVTESGELIGSVSPETKNVNLSPLTVAPSTPLESVHELFASLGPRVVFVVDKGRLIGLITRKDLLRAHTATSVQLSSFEERLGRFVASTLSKISIPRGN